MTQAACSVHASAPSLQRLPPKFTLTQLQRTVEAILGREVEKSAFRRRLKGDATLEEVPGEFERGVQRPAQLYRASEGFVFEA